MAISTKQRALIKAFKDTPLKAPWVLLPKITAYDANKHVYSLRTATVIPSVQLLEPFLQAVELYYSTDEHLAAMSQRFRMVEKRRDSDTTTYVEMALTDNMNIVVFFDGKELRANLVSTDDSSLSVIPAFTDLSKIYDGIGLTATALALLPSIFSLDGTTGGSKLRDAATTLGEQISAAPSAWTDKDAIPEIVKDSAYFLDGILIVLENMGIETGTVMASTESPDEIEATRFTNGKLEGPCVRENLCRGTWEPKIVVAKGTVKQFNGGVATLEDAKSQYSAYSKNRNWTPQERSLIPKLPADMPVMPEVLRIASRITNTEQDVNPVCNVMWRGVTSYGKSTGVKQLAAILDMPLLTLTCHPNMEAQDFISQMVPDAKTEGILLDMNNIHQPKRFAEGVQRPMPALLEQAVSYVSSLEDAQFEAIMDAPDFYTTALMDSASAAELLLGPGAQVISLEDLLWLYAETTRAIMEKPLQEKLAELEATKPEQAETREKNFLEFIHVCSPYLKAMANGYLIEIQEASRIRDSGVMVSINEFDRPNAVIPLMNGYTATRHPKALCIITDNVGYASCRPIDPSVLRRQSMIIDSYELPKELLIDRVKRNTGVTDTALLDKAYDLWDKVQSYCKQNVITDGSVSPMELERFVQAIKYDGPDSVSYNLDDCIISKATNDLDSQREIRTACQTLVTGF